MIPPKKTTEPKQSPFDVLAAEFVAEARESGHIPVSTDLVPEIAFAGRSNVGKSTLLNAVSQRKGLARTSRTPGCTRGVIMFDLKLRSGVQVRLVDLPGYGFAQRAKTERKSWGPLIESYLLNRDTLRGVMILVDARRGPESEELELAEFLRTIKVPYVLIATKVDKMSRTERGLAIKQLAAENGVRVLGASGETGEGREDVVRAMVSMAIRPPAEG